MTSRTAAAMYPALAKQAAQRTAAKASEEPKARPWWEDSSRWDSKRPPIAADYSKVPGLRKVRGE